MKTVTTLNLSLLFIAITIWEICDALAPKGVAYAAPAFSVCAALTLLAVCVQALGMSNSKTRAPKELFLLLFVMFTTSLIASTFNVVAASPISNRHLLVDILIFPLILIIVVSLPAGFVAQLKIRDMFLLFAGSFFAALLAPIAENYQLLPQYLWAGRFDAPSYIAASIVSTYVVFGNRLVARFFSLLIYATFLSLALEGGSRTGLILVVFPLFAAIFLRAVALKSYKGQAFIMLTSFGVIAITFTLLLSLTGDASQRALQLSEISADNSLLARLYEANDVLNIYIQGSPMQLIFGFGPGSLWQASLTDTTAATRDVIAGRVYYIHIGPVALLYRYGIFGLLFFAAFIKTAYKLFRTIKSNCGQGNGYDLAAITVLIALIGVLLNWTLRSSLNDFSALVLSALAFSTLAHHESVSVLKDKRA